MSQQTENQISFEPIRTLELFPTRKIQCLDFDFIKYKKLFDILNCPLCKQIFTNPTYLKCSHRFCKECIEKYIRNTDKRSCPVCKTQIATKRDSKLDLRLISLISFAYGDAAILQQDINKREEQNVKNLKLVKTKSGIQTQLKRDRPQSMDAISKKAEQPSRKQKKDVEQSNDKQESQQNKVNILQNEANIVKQKVNEKQAQSQKTKKKKPQAQIDDDNNKQAQPVVKIQRNKSKQSKNKQSQNIPEPKSISNSASPWQNTKTKTSKKKTQIIQIFSQQCSNQVEIYTNKNTQQTQQNTQKDISSNNIRKQNQNVKSNDKVQQKQKLIVNTQESFFKDNQFDEKIISSRNKLKETLGNQYLKVLLKRSQKICSLNLTLLPKSKLTPPLPKPQFQLSLNIKISNIISLILLQLNISQNKKSQNLIELSIITKQNKQQKLTGQDLTIMNIIQNYWKDYKGMGVFDILKTINQTSKRQKNSKIIYYSFNYKQISKSRMQL